VLSPLPISPVLAPPIQEELDYSLFWVTVYHSSIPYFKSLAEFLREQLGIHLWEVRRQQPFATAYLLSIILPPLAPPPPHPPLLGRA
jgi:hypothetical protein